MILITGMHSRGIKTKRSIMAGKDEALLCEEEQSYNTEVDVLILYSCFS